MLEVWESMMLGLKVILALIIWMCIELILLVSSNKKFVLRWLEGKERKYITLESREYKTTALTLSGLTFAGIALMIDAFSKNLQEAIDTLIILFYSFGLFLISYRFEVLTNYRFYWIIQEKTLNFGFLGLIFSLLIFVYLQKLTYFLVPLIVIVIAIILIHLIEFKFDYKYYSNVTVNNS
jgi:hypothetical protein